MIFVSDMLGYFTIHILFASARHVAHLQRHLCYPFEFYMFKFLPNIGLRYLVPFI
jgi:hypothetical protein